ncbi:MAG: 3'(2'),5'-bisphosphate nucleotidase CysQ [Acidobacteriota bacterium]|nr:3'(2'),5'-bisphosphate nucleotidase CysQ [Acidobacteriota bacterium]
MEAHKLVALALRAAVAAGEDIMDVYAAGFTVDRKADQSPLTEADRRAHARITEMLGPAGIPVLSEEGRGIPYDERHAWPGLWIVDPLDGTKEFIKRNGEFTVNIALVQEGRPVLGVVYAPAANALYLGETSLGGFKLAAERSILRAMVSEGERLLERFVRLAVKLPFAPSGIRPFTVVASRSHMNQETESFIEDLRRDHADLELASIGSSLKLCLVAEGTADVYPRFAPTMEWDTAAGQAVAEASGARVVSAPNGASLAYNKPDLHNPWFIVVGSGLEIQDF